MKIETDIDGLVELVSSVTEAYTTAFFLADNQKRMLRLWRFYSLSDNVIADAVIPFGAGPIGWVAENREEFDISKFSDRDSGLLRLYSRNENIKSFLAVPVMNGGVLEGVLCIDSKKTFVFTSKEQKLLKLFAKQFANLLNNIRVEKFVDTDISDVTFLHDFCKKTTAAGNIESILQLALNSIMELVECDSYFISLQTHNDEAGEFRVEVAHGSQNMRGAIFSAQDGLAGHIIRSKEPFLLTNRKEGYESCVFIPSESLGRVRSFLGVPLLFKDTVPGLICLTDSREGLFSQRDLKVVSIIADNVSLAIANAMAQEKVYRLSTNTDGLTELYNFSGFQEQLETIFQALSRKNRPLSLLIMDLDDFRGLNSDFGYEIGNEVLKRFAHLLLSIGRYEIIISAARCGDDEFALILPGTTREPAFSIAESICKEVEDPTFISPSRGVRVSVSIGVSSYPQDGMDKDDLVENALRALSAAKSQGGGRASCYNAKMPEFVSKKVY